MKLLKSALTDKDLCNVLIVLVLPMFPMFVRGPRSVSYVHSLSMVHALDQECVQIAERAMILAIKAVTSSKKSKKRYYCLQQNILALGMLKNCYLNDLTQLQYRISIQSLLSQLQDLTDLRQYSQRHHEPPLVGLLGPPLVGLLGPPLVGILGPPLVGILGPPLVGLLGPPLVGLLGPPRASSGGAPLASSGGAPRASSGGAPRASSGGAPRASSGGAPRAFSCGALPVSSGGASQASAGGASGVPPHGTSSSSLKTPQTSGVPQGSSHNSGIRFEPQSPDCSLAQSGSPSNLNYFSLSGSLPDLQNLPDSNENFEIVVHKTMDAEEVESIAVGQKRARSPSSPHSNSHGVGRNAKSKTGRANEGPSNKKSAVEPKSKGGDKSKSSVKVIPGKVSLSRSQIPKLDSKKHPSKSK